MTTRGLLLAVCAVVASLAFSASASANDITVNTGQDEFGTGADCSLREAIQAANTNTAFGGCPTASPSGTDTIFVTGGSQYNVGMGGTAEDANASGDFDITSFIRIAATGTGNARIDGGGFDRVFQILAHGSLLGTHLDIVNGNAVAQTNTAGGGILDQGVLNLRDSIVQMNRSTSNTGCDCGGGIAVDGTAILNDVRVTNNNTDNIGGGIQFLGGTLRAKFLTVDHNTAVSSGGGIDLDASGTSSAVIKNTTINGNAQTGTSTNAGGAGIGVSGDTGPDLSAENVTITGNRAAGYGGGVFVYSGALSLSSATVVRNVSSTGHVAGFGGGGLAGMGVSARNSIVALNTDENPSPSPANPAQDCFIHPAVSDSLIGRKTGCNGGGGNHVTNDPKLRSHLNVNGGIVKTIALRRKSPAVGAAKKPVPKTDERGVRRDRHPDLGAFEFVRSP